MLWRKVFLRMLFKGNRFAKRSRTGKGTNRRKNLVSKPMGINIVGDKKLRKQKMGHQGIDLEEGRVSKRRRIRENYGIDDINGYQDRFSELPEPIIHHIFSFLHCTKDIVRTSVLAKRWKSVFDSYPLFDFDERWFRVKPGRGKHNRIKAREIQRKKFKSYVDKTIALKLDPAPCIDKFRLYVINNTHMMRCTVQIWACAAAERDVKELDIRFRRNEKWFTVPYDVLVSASITSLKLAGAAIMFGLPDVKMSNLRQLSIKDAFLVDESAIKKFEEGYPLIEDLRLVFCEGLFRLNISNLSKLRRVEVHNCSKLEYIGIEAASLETFLYYTRKDHEDCTLNLKGSGNLKNLTLKDCKMTDDALQDLISKCHLLENLVLHECNHLGSFTSLSEKLKSLALIKCEKLSEIVVDAPNLYSFHYSGFKIPFSAMNCVGLCAAKFHFGRISRNRCRHFDYQKLLGDFHQSKGFKLIEHTNQTMQIYEEPREARLTPRSVFKLVLTRSYRGVLKVVDEWLKERHPRSLLVVAPSDELTKLLQSLLIDREDSPSCCASYTNKCWRHHIADVKNLTLTNIRRAFFEFEWRPKQKSH